MLSLLVGATEPVMADKDGKDFKSEPWFLVLVGGGVLGAFYLLSSIAGGPFDFLSSVMSSVFSAENVASRQEGRSQRSAERQQGRTNRTRARQSERTERVCIRNAKRASNCTWWGRLRNKCSTKQYNKLVNQCKEGNKS